MKTRAAIVTAPEQPVIIDELGVPDPKPHQVIVKLFSTGVCRSNVHDATGANPVPYPALLGHEGVGVVTHVGRDVTHLKEGDHAIVTWIPRPGFTGPLSDFWDSLGPVGVTYRGQIVSSPWYTWAEDALAPGEIVIPIPKEDASLESCIVGCAVLTGGGAVLHTAKVRPEDSVAVIGAGGVGLSAIKMASMLQAYPVIAVDVTDEKLEFAREWGATHTVNASEVDPVEAIREITGGGADFVFEAIGKRETQEQILPATRSGGTGANNVGGTAVLIGAPAPEITLDPSHFVVHQRQYRGSPGASVPEKDFPMYLRWNREGKWPLDKQVTRQYKLDDANQAVEDLAAGRIAGRAIIVL